MNDCLICGTELEERRVTRLQGYNGRWYYTPQAHDRVIDLITGDAEPVRVEQVAVLDAR